MVLCPRPRKSASAPEIISISSLVITAWRVKLNWIVKPVDHVAALRRGVSIAEHPPRACSEAAVLEQRREDLRGPRPRGQQVRRGFSSSDGS